MCRTVILRARAGSYVDRMKRVALIGYGLGGRSFHAPLIAVTPGLRLDAIVTSNPERRRQATAEHPTARLLESAEDVFAHSRDFDLVVVTTPNRTHVPLARRALEAGIPTVVDKPLAPTSAEARELVELSRRRKVLLTVYHNRRFDGDFRVLTRLVREQTLGAVHRFESRFERWRPQLKGGWREKADPHEAGGLLFDLGSHLIDQALQLFGPVADVYAEADARRRDAQVDDDVFLALTHENGVRSHLWMTVLAADRAPRFRLFGLEGTYTKLGMDVQEEALRGGKRPGSPDWGVEPRELWGVIANGETTSPVPTPPGAYQDFYGGVATSLTTGAPPPVDPRDAVAVIEVIETAKVRARTGAERD
jgi:scyllo-inositol 2-dehydrogenase (NADP+)